MTLTTRYAPDQVAEVRCGWRGDVVVVGGGSTGCSAALAAARAGARTLVVESGGFIGVTATRVLDTFYGVYARGERGERVVAGIGWEVCEQLDKPEMSFERPNTYEAGTGVTYEPEALKVVWDELVSGAGVDLLLDGLMTAVFVDGGRVVGVVVESKAGPLPLDAVVVVGSGEGDVAWRAGAELAPSMPLDGIQPATSTFRLGGVARESATTNDIHALTDDFRGALCHDDDIARCGAPIEDDAAGGATRWEYVGGLPAPDGATYGIPFRTLVPKELDGLLAAGRFFSATHEAHASARSVAMCDPATATGARPCR